MVTDSDLHSICDFISRRISLPQQRGRKCDGTPAVALQYLQSIDRAGELDSFLEYGHAECDCTFLLNYTAEEEPGCTDCDGPVIVGHIEPETIH